VAIFLLTFLRFYAIIFFELNEKTGERL